MRKNEHPGCSCKACRRGKHTRAGHYTIRAINRKLRRLYRIALRQASDEQVQIIVSTPPTD